MQKWRAVHEIAWTSWVCQQMIADADDGHNETMTTKSMVSKAVKTVIQLFQIACLVYLW